MLRPSALLLLLVSCVAAHAQRLSTETGTVSGHVICTDTQRPARLAEVRLVPVSITAAAKPNFYEDQGALGNALPPVQTDLDGNYTVHNVVPGTYYLRVDYTGYLTPLLAFSRNQLAHPTPEVQKRVANELTTVAVAAHTTTRADTTIKRGAAIFGTVLYDDGSPAVGVPIDLRRADAKGEFKDQVPLHGFGLATDDHGHYRIDSLAADSYVVTASFSLSQSVITTMPNPAGSGTMQMNIMKILFSLPLYSGDVFRRHDATVIKTEEGQDAAAVNLTLPLSNLHSVSGAVTARDGHALSSGDVTLLYADTREELTEVPLNREDGRFTFPYVPQGNYIVTVKKAEDVTQIQIPNPPGSNPKFHLEDKVQHSYGTVEQPLAVTGELASVLIVVPEEKQP